MFAILGYLLKMANLKSNRWLNSNKKKVAHNWYTSTLGFNAFTHWKIFCTVIAQTIRYFQTKFRFCLPIHKCFCMLKWKSSDSWLKLFIYTQFLWKITLAIHKFIWCASHSVNRFLYSSVLSVTQFYSMIKPFFSSSKWRYVFSFLVSLLLGNENLR